MNNIILIPLYKINSISKEVYDRYTNLVEINIDNIRKLNINAEILIIKKNTDNLRNMWYDVLTTIIDLTNKKKNILYMEADTILFKNCNEIFNYNKCLCFGLGYWNMSFKNENEFNFYEYWNSGLVYFPSNCNYDSIINLYKNWPMQDDKISLNKIFPNYNFNFGNRALDYSGTYWEYICNILFYSQFSNKQDGIKYIANNFGLWKYNYRGCLYKKYPNKNLLANSNNISHCHFLIHSSNKDKKQRFSEILKIYYQINNLLNDDNLLKNYIYNIADIMF
tara:strand:+ start:1316 stop:2152 length:837 start_codon:yes stop_codon:yes gene_type:complete